MIIPINLEMERTSKKMKWEMGNLTPDVDPRRSYELRISKVIGISLIPCTKFDFM